MPILTFAEVTELRLAARALMFFASTIHLLEPSHKAYNYVMKIGWTAPDLQKLAQTLYHTAKREEEAYETMEG